MILSKDRLVELATKVAELVAEKNAAYGSSFETVEVALRALFPDGITPDRFIDALCIVRIWDKLSRIANKKDAFGESPYGDIVGYALLGLERDSR